MVTTERHTAVRDSVRLLTVMRDSVAIRDSVSVITRRDTVFLEKIQTTEKTPARVSFFANWMPWILIFFLSLSLIYILFNGLRR